MKAALYWTIRMDFGIYKPFAVTSEGARGRINGRYDDGFASHTTRDRTYGKFDSYENAKARVDRIAEIKLEYEKLREPLENQITDLHNKERITIREAVK